jgi:hypothetical protein
MSMLLADWKTRHSESYGTRPEGLLEPIASIRSTTAKTPWPFDVVWFGGEKAGRPRGCLKADALTYLACGAVYPRVTYCGAGSSALTFPATGYAVSFAAALSVQRPTLPYYFALNAEDRAV